MINTRYINIAVLLFAFVAGWCQPEPPVVTRVDIDTENRSHVYWDHSVSPDVEFYRVFAYDTIGENPFPSGIDVPNGTIRAISTQEQYEHFFFYDSVNYKSVTYTLKSVDFDDSTSLFSNMHSTIYLTVEAEDECQSVMHLEWNDYSAWRGNIREYNIVARLNNVALRNINVPEGVNEYDLEIVREPGTYTFFIRAVNNDDPALTSRSNHVEIISDISIYPEYIYAEYGTVEAGQPAVRFLIDPDSELTQYMIGRSGSPGGPFDSLTTISTSESFIEYTDDADAGAGTYYYNLTAINDCGAEVITSENIAGTIFLTAFAEGNEVQLNWTPYYEWPAGIESYSVEKRTANSDFISIATVSSNDYRDIFDENSISENELYYRIVAHENPGNGFTSEQAISISNVAIVRLEENVRFEYNAFTPGGSENNDFGPTMDFLPDNYEFSVFNRWGNRVFRTGDPLERWNGEYQNKPAAMGVYRWQIKYTDAGNNERVIHGTVTLIR
ncbi:MAG: gliding motility-associated C-terminal domain-containing protein [Bacteroidales bacterium]|nr:gliding motility-associated C-terminal domain-containing protein [Bacteroidales bacterium]